jgi:hypothetical protein
MGDAPELSIGDDGQSLSLLQTYWGDVDALDANRVALHFAPGAWFQVGQQPPIHGRAAIRQAFIHLFTEAEVIQHYPVALWSKHGLTVAEADISVVFENRSSIIVPITTTLWHQRNDILACRVHVPQEPGLTYAISGFICSQTPQSVRQ